VANKWNELFGLNSPGTDVNTSDADDVLSGIQHQVQSTLLAQEQIYNQIRMTGEEAPAIIISLMDTGVRIGDNASMLRFRVEVSPRNRPSFQAETQNAISDASRSKFVPGATIYVRFIPSDTTQVAIDHAPTSAASARVVNCPSCGATARAANPEATCAYCGTPLMA
jgi:hypothetical protein